MRICRVTECSGHVGKFADCASEALWMLSLDGSESDTGSVEDGFDFLSLVIVKEPTGVALQDGREVTLVPGSYLVFCSEQGFVNVIRYDLESEARQAYDRCDRAYADYLDNRDWRI